MILIDADSLVYACGFACQKSISAIVAEDDFGNLRKDTTDNLTHWRADNPGWKIVDRDVQVEAQPEVFAINALRLALSTIVAKCGNDKYQTFITGSTNFRDKIATILPYKGNRDKLHKPVHYAALRSYLLDVDDAVLVEGMEADDEVSIRATLLAAKRKKFLVVSIDKDLNQIPGKHYNPQKDEFYEIGRLDGYQWFIRQCLTGDSTDNVGGVWRFGPAAADKFLESVYTKALPIWPAIVACYADSQQKAGCPYTHMDAASAALENARLVYMLKHHSEAIDYWSPPEDVPAYGADSAAAGKQKVSPTSGGNGK